MSLPLPCNDCLAGPHGLEGHAALFLSQGLRTPSGRHLFKCARCQRLWLRNYEGDGTFRWIEVSPEEAVGSAE